MSVPVMIAGRAAAWTGWHDCAMEISGHIDVLDSCGATFLPASLPLAFWARRQAHETAIHCADAELAAGSPAGYPAEFAADGVDEILVAFFGRGAGPAGESSGGADSRLLLVSAADTGRDWHVRLSGDLGRIIATGRGKGPDGAAPGCALSGPAAALYLLLWNRAGLTADVQVSGDTSLLSSWTANMRLTWG